MYIVHDDAVMCKKKLLNEFFASVFTREYTNTLPEIRDVYDGTFLDNVTITPDMLREEVTKLTPSLSSGLVVTQINS